MNTIITIKGHLSKFCLILLVPLLLSCDLGNNLDQEVETGISVLEELNLEFKYAESYDVEKITFSRQIPNEIAAKANSMVGGELIWDFSNFRETIAYDGNGDMTYVQEYIDGNDAMMNMPQSVYQLLEGSIPNRSGNIDPIEKIIISNGYERLYGQSGNLVYEYTHDPSEFNVPPSSFDESQLPGFSARTLEERVQKSLSILERLNVQYERYGDFYAMYDDLNLDGEDLTYRNLIDLRHGQPVRTEVIRDDGRYESVLFSNYEIVNGLPIMSNELNYQYGDINGSWQVAYKTHTSRTNIKVIIN